MKFLLVMSVVNMAASMIIIATTAETNVALVAALALTGWLMAALEQAEKIWF